MTDTTLLRKRFSEDRSKTVSAVKSDDTQALSWQRCQEWVSNRWGTVNGAVEARVESDRGDENGPIRTRDARALAPSLGVLADD